MKDYFGTWRILRGDSAFASYQLCTALLVVGLFFGGIVKQATKSFPIEFFLRIGQSLSLREETTQL